MTSAESVARYFVHLASSSEPSPITHMQLQKLLYYAQGWSLARRDRALFSERIEAWAHGPVVRSVFPKFADFADRPIAGTEGAALLEEEDRELVEWVWRRYGQYSAWRLREMTHREPPWREARGDLPEGAPAENVVEAASMKRFFRRRHEADCKRLGIDPEELDRSIESARRGRVSPMIVPPEGRCVLEG